MSVQLGLESVFTLQRNKRSRSPEYALCVLSTGGGLSTRELYTNDDEVLFDAVRPIILNGIEEIAVRGDLLDRSIVLMLPQIEEDDRKYEKTYWCEFEEKRPAIFGALLDAVVEALGTVDMVELPRRPRMADFARWSCAAAPALGWTSDEFLTAYDRNRASSNTVALDSSLFASAIVDLVGQGRWECTASELLRDLGESCLEETQKKTKEWPKAPRNASDALRILAPNLRRAGVAVDFDRTAKSRLIFLEKLEDPASSSRTSYENGDLTGAQEQTWDDDSDIAPHHLSSHMHLPASHDDVEHSQNDGAAKAASYAKSLKTRAYDDSDADDDSQKQLRTLMMRKFLSKLV